MAALISRTGLAGAERAVVGLRARKAPTSSRAKAAGESVRHSHPTSKRTSTPTVTARSASDRVVQQHLVITDVNADRLHADKSTAKVRSPRMFRVRARR